MSRETDDYNRKLTELYADTGHDDPCGDCLTEDTELELLLAIALMHSVLF